MERKMSHTISIRALNDVKYVYQGDVRGFFEGILCLCLATVCLGKISSSDKDEGLEVDNARNKKVLGLFNVVKFPNDPCSGSSNNNGTCYTSSECSSKGWVSDGTCASGYGVCCIVKPGCGGKSSENITYLDSGSAKLSTYPGACTYSICPKSASICRIRFDFESFTIGGPLVNTDAAVTTQGGAIGDCAGDRFSITSSAGKGSPVICGTNSGQHMIMDVSTGCLQANFYLTSSSTATYNVKVTQYQCGSEMGGPTGCLQYFTSVSGSFSSFNYISSTNSLSNPHLSNQCYDICIRRAQGNCYICFYVSTTPVEYFGLSAGAVSIDDASKIDTDCSSDFIQIPGGTTMVIAQTSAAGYVPFASRFCGRILATTSDAIAQESVCTRLAPFRVSFKTDADEVTTSPTEPSMNELLGTTFGTTGFKLTYQQSSC